MKLEHITRRYGDRTVLADVTFDFPARGLCVIAGPSGCGKTTLLRVLAGLDAPQEGTVTGRGTVAMHFQEHRLFPQLTALENITRVSWREPNEAHRAGAERMLRTLGFSDADMSLKPAALSGGMAQRVSVARALCAEADCVLLDEPLKELDENLRQTVLRLLTDKARDALVIVTAHEAETIPGAACVLRPDA